MDLIASINDRFQVLILKQGNTTTCYAITINILRWHD